MTRWLDFIVNFGHLQQRNFANGIIIFAKVGSKLCPKQNKPSKNCQSRFKLCQGGKNSENMVTLPSPHCTCIEIPKISTNFCQRNSRHDLNNFSSVSWTFCVFCHFQSDYLPSFSLSLSLCVCFYFLLSIKRYYVFSPFGISPYYRLG